MHTRILDMLQKHSIKIIQITSDKRFRCTSCYSGYEPIDAKANCLECFGSSYRAVISWIDGIIIKPARNPDADKLAGYENPRGFRVYVKPATILSVGDVLLEVDPQNQVNSQQLRPPVSPLHAYMVETREALYYEGKVVCYQCTCRVEDILLENYTKLLSQL